MPVSEAAKTLSESERTVRWQVQAGTREATYLPDGRIAILVPRRARVVVPLVARQAVDPRKLELMARERCQPGESMFGLTRRRDGKEWRAAEHLAGVKK